MVVGAGAASGVGMGGLGGGGGASGMSGLPGTSGMGGGSSGNGGATGGGGGMTGGGFYSGGGGGGVSNQSASETDGETFDGDADFEDFDEWDMNEMMSNLSKHFKLYVVQPFVVGAAAAFGMSVGYAMFDATCSLFVRKPRAR